MRKRVLISGVVAALLLVPEIVPASNPFTGERTVTKQLPEPVYPVMPDFEDARIIVSVLVGTDGKIDSASVKIIVCDVHERATAAARKWLFTPGLNAQGKPVPVVVAIPFRLKAGQGD